MRTDRRQARGKAEDRLEKQLDYVTAAGKKHRLKNRLEEWLDERLEDRLED